MANVAGDLVKRAERSGRSASDVVLEAVRETGSMKSAARLLGVSRSTVKHHMLKAGATVNQRLVAEISLGKA